MGENSNNIEARFTTNQQGIRIKVCCASCEHRRLTDKHRICRFTKRRVESGHVCRRWEMSEALGSLCSKL